MASPNYLISYKTARAKIGKLPSLQPCPTATKKYALYTHLHEVLAKVLSFQSANHGYQGMVDAAYMYALMWETPWIDFPDPGFHRQADGSLNPVAQRDAEAIFNATIMVYTSQQNVKGAVNDALNEAVPEAYCCNPNVIGVREFWLNNDPRQIIALLATRYRQKTTMEVNKQDERWRTRYPRTYQERILRLGQNTLPSTCLSDRMFC